MSKMEGGTTFYFITAGIRAALEQARELKYALGRPSMERVDKAQPR